MENEEKSEFEELSAWIDKEDNSLSEDQQKSDESKQIAEDFKKIDAAMAKVSSAPQPSADLAAKISAKCNEKAAIPFARHIYRAVAVLAACLVVTFIYKDQDKKNDTLTQVTEENTAPKATPVLKSLDKENEKKFEALRSNPSPATPSGDFNLIGTNPKENLASTVALTDEVKHVWVSENPEGTALQLLKLAGNLNPVNSKVDRKGNVNFSITVSDQDLLKIVNKLNEDGNALVSKEFPQPNQLSKVSTSGKMIRYNVSILQKN
ncbi:MAG: hypothetical protein NE328_05175 [Lentisphaeraceae bacterium]|nr:hypothetical protein [Lentisphaeraceae bacterium]